MRILFVTPVAEAGGSDQALLRMVRVLAATASCHVVVPAPSPLADDFTAAGATLHVVPMRRITTSGGRGWWLRYALEWPLAVARLVRLGRRLRVDVVASNSLHTWYGWAAARLLRRPHVWHAREVVVQSPAALALERRLVARAADLLVSCSRVVDDQFADVLPAGRRVVVHEDVDRDEFTPARTGRFRPARGVPPGAPLVGFAGRVDTWKGVDVLLDAWPRVLDRLPDARLVVVGGPVAGKHGYHDGLRARAAQLPGVDWVGTLPGTADVMADLDVLAAPSTLPEPYGLVLVEALASGAAVVSTDAGGPPEILARAAPGAGRLVPVGDPVALADALVAVLAQSSGRPRAALVDPFPVDWLAVYRRAAARGAGAPAAMP